MRPQLGKDKILNAALQLFAKNGFHETSISQIALAAAVSKGLMYNYFKSKEELLLAIIDHASEGMFEIAENMAPNPAEAPQSYQQVLDHFLRQFAAFLKTNEDYLSFQLSLLFQPKLKNLVQGPLQSRADHLLLTTEQMFHAAHIEHAAYTARRFLAELDGITLHYLSVFKDYPLDHMLKQLFQNYKDLPK